MSKWLRDERDKKIVPFDKLDKAVTESVNKDGPEVTPLPEPENWRTTDSVILKTDGYWWIFSKVDKRWCAEGKGEVGGISMCREAKAKFEDFKKRFGKQPWDLTYRFEPRNLKKFKLANDVKIDDLEKYKNILNKQI
jgi:hypothetical protein